MSQLLRQRPTELPVIQAQHVHTTNEIRRKLDALALCRVTVQGILDSKPAEEEWRKAVALRHDIERAEAVQWQPETEHYTGLAPLSGQHEDGVAPCVREVKIGHLQVALLDAALDECATSTLIPEELFLKLVAAQHPSYKVTPVKWRRKPKLELSVSEALHKENSELVDEELPHHAVQFDSKQEAANWMRDVFPKLHPGCTPRCVLG